jgi:hypothetical protein
MTEKWVTISLILAVLLVFGLVAYENYGPQSRKQTAVVDVQSVSSVPNAPTSNPVLGYTQGLQQSVSRAHQNADKYEQAAENRSDAAKEAIAGGE